MSLLLEHYLGELRDTHASGENVSETSFYPALANLFNNVGATLNPKVRIVIILRNRGAGLPDGGLFTARQLRQLGGDDALREPAAFKGQQPERGVVEVKSPRDNVRDIAVTKQVRSYLSAYGQVLVTNLRDFLLVTKDADGEPRFGESYSLAPDEKTFWQRVRQPREFAAAHDALFIEYLKRVMQAAAPLEDPRDLAWFLASYARDAKSRIEKADLPSLQSVRAAMEQALELKFEGERGEAFFRSTLVQTLFYGIFSAWVLWAKSSAARRERFNWKLAEWSLHVPVIRTLFEQVVRSSNLRGLGLVEVLDWTGETLNRVRRDLFFARFEEEHAVQYFYEPFLEAFDPDLRKQLGVWYTPAEIVRYMVERVDHVLRAELDIENGLADERVYVLDPCCGTGAYLVEVLRRIKRTIDEQGGDALTAIDLKNAARERVFGFEILPAPFVVAHLQLGLLLQKEGSPLGDEERVGVYLTNALTGWEPPKEPKRQLAFEFHSLQEERDAAEAVKRDRRILVVLGNPPYNGFAGMAVAEERKLSDAYRTTKRAPAPQGQGLNDLYVRFFRIAERRIVEKTGAGVVCYISNYSWLDGLSFTGMRERYMESFDKVWIDNLHGDRIISEYAPDGRTSETVFAIRGKSAGIKVGTAISLMVAKSNKAAGRVDEGNILYRDFDQAKAADRRSALIASLADGDLDSAYVKLDPPVEIGFPFKRSSVGTTYLSWPLLSDLFPVSFPGIQPSRDDVVVDIDRARLIARMEKYFDASVSHDEMARIAPGAMDKGYNFDAIATRSYLQQRGFLEQFVIRYVYRPFDVRWLYWEPETGLLDRKREDYFPHIFEGNLWLGAAQRNRRDFDPPLIVQSHASRHIIERGANLFPLCLRKQAHRDLFNAHETNDADAATTQTNLSDDAKLYLRTLDVAQQPGLLFFHVAAVLHAPNYRDENAGALRQDWPRVPLPASREVLEASAALGHHVAALLDTEARISGVTAGTIRPELRGIANIRRVDGPAPLNPQAGDLDLRAGWGHRGKGGVVMPGKGQSTLRAYTDAERNAFDEGAARLGLSSHDFAAAFGAETYDVYLNDVAAWMNVPARVWEYTIGGYQVIKKWLSYREADILGRGLTAEEAREVTHIARRIAAILLLERALDANYEQVKAQTYRASRA